MTSVGGAVGVEPELEPDEAAAAAVIRWFEMFAEQMTRAPPPLAEPLHWLTLTLAAEDSGAGRGALQLDQGPAVG